MLPDCTTSQEVIEGEAFKGSHRSGQFLVYIVEESIAGRFNSFERAGHRRKAVLDVIHPTTHGRRRDRAGDRERRKETVAAALWKVRIYIRVPHQSASGVVHTRDQQGTAKDCERSHSPSHSRASGCGSCTGRRSACRWPYRRLRPG